MPICRPQFAYLYSNIFSHRVRVGRRSTHSNAHHPWFQKDFAAFDLDRRMLRALFTRTPIAIMCTLLGDMISRADVMVYVERCGHYAHEDWILTCKVAKNTFANMVPFAGGPFTELQSITICASFNNHGGLNAPATVIYNYKNRDQEQDTPLHFFDTVKFQGNLIAKKMSWVGTSPRGVVWSPAWRMRGELIQIGQDSITYTETLLSGQRPIAEIRSTCSYLEDP